MSNCKTCALVLFCLSDPIANRYVGRICTECGKTEMLTYRNFPHTSLGALERQSVVSALATHPIPDKLACFRVERAYFRICHECIMKYPHGRPGIAQ